MNAYQSILISFLFALVVFFPSLSKADVPQNTPKSQQILNLSSQRTKRVHTSTKQKNLHVAQAAKGTSDPQSTSGEMKLEEVAPRSAWIFESLSATVATFGFVTLAIGATTLGRRDQLIASFKSPSSSFSSSPRPSAKEVKELQDIGAPMVLTGLIVSGIGVAGMLVGGIWLLAHKMPGRAPSGKKLSQIPSQTTPSHARTLTLLQTPF